MTLPLRTSTMLTPRNPDWEPAVRANFARQGPVALLGAELTALRPGYAEVRLRYRPDLSQHNGYFHSGITATAVDTAGGHAALSLMPAGCEVLAVEFKINLIAPADGEELIAEAQVIKSGRTLTVIRGEVYARKGDSLSHCASMQQTLMTMTPRKDAP